MSSALTEYLNAWYRAETYARDAKSYIERNLGNIDSALSSLYSEITSKLKNLPEFSLDQTLEREISSLISIAKASLPVRPRGLDSDISIPDVGEYKPYRTDILRDAIRKIMYNLDNLPSKLLYGVNLLDELYRKIYNDLVNGGYGIEPEDEEALWNRARDRELKNIDVSINDIMDKASAFGYVLPPGVVLNTIQESIDKAQYNLSELNREITIKRADLFRDNRRFAIDTARQLSEQLIGLTKFKIESLHRVTEADIAAARLTLEEFRTEVEVFKTRVDKAIAENKLLAEIWSIDLDAWGKRASASVQAAQVLIAASAQILEGLKFVYAYNLDGIKIFESIWEKQVDVLLEKIRQVTSILSAASASAFGTLSGIFSLIQTEEEEED